MSAAIFISYNDSGALTTLDRLQKGLSDRSVLLERMAVAGENFTRDYLRAIAPGRHKTANKLGVAPLNHLIRAAENVTHRVEGDAAVVGVTSPGISRALHDLTIRPVNGGWLTLPMHANAYGRRASSLARLIGVPLFRPLKKGAKAQASTLSQTPGKKGDKAAGRRSKRFNSSDRMKVLGAHYGGKFVIFYAIVRQVHQAQDRTLLPSNQAYLEEAQEVALDYVAELQAKKGAQP